MLIVGFCYIWCGAATSEFSAMAAFTVLWFGWCSSAPTSVSIISVCLCGMYEGQTTTNPLDLGKVLSWNNFCYQASVIVAPMILTTIYDWNKNATYYFSSITGFVGFLIMMYILTWKNAKVIGKVSEFKEESDVEMKPVDAANDEVEITKKNEETVSPVKDSN